MELDELHVGDRIEYFRGSLSYSSERIGQTGTIRGIRRDNDGILISWDDDYNPSDTSGWNRKNILKIEPDVPEMPVPEFFKKQEERAT